MYKTVLLLGGNEGDVPAVFVKVLRMLEEAGTVEQTSALYCSESWGFESENEFINQAVIFNTHLSPGELLDFLLSVEKKLGRVRQNNGVYSSRNIDIDILFTGDRIVD